MEDQEMYEIQYIFGSQILDNKMQYSVKWKNYPKSQRTWEPVENLGIHNMSSVRRYQRHADYFLFYNFVNQENINDGYRVHQKSNTLETIKLIPQEIQDDIPEITDKINTQTTTTQNIKRRPKIEQISENSDSKDSDYGKRSKKSKKSKSSQSRKKSPPEKCDKSNSIQQSNKKNINIKQEQSNENDQQITKQSEPEIQPQTEIQNDNQSIKSQSQQPSKMQTRQKITSLSQKKQPETIKTTAYYNHIRHIINNMEEDQRNQINSYILEQKKENVLEQLSALLIYDYILRRDEVLGVIKLEQLELPPICEQKQKEQRSNKKSKKNYKSHLKMDSQRSTDITVTPKEQRRLIRISAFESSKKKKQQQQDNTPYMKDILNTMQLLPQFGMVETQIDHQKEYGQIGFQVGEAITGHYFGINACDMGKANIQLYFILEFRREGEKTFLYNHVTQAECMLYEKDLLYEYILKNQQILPELYNELFVRSVYNNL